MFILIILTDFTLLIIKEHDVYLSNNLVKMKKKKEFLIFFNDNFLKCVLSSTSVKGLGTFFCDKVIKLNTFDKQ